MINTNKLQSTVLHGCSQYKLPYNSQNEPIVMQAYQEWGSQCQFPFNSQSNTRKMLAVLLILIATTLLFSGCKSDKPSDSQDDPESPASTQQDANAEGGSNGDDQGNSNGDDSDPDMPLVSGLDNIIGFTGDDLYAVAYLGYADLDTAVADSFTQKYLGTTSDALPFHFVSNGDFYLIIPRYNDTHMYFWKNDVVENPELIYEAETGDPFIVQCNISDIFPDFSVVFEYNDETIEYSPFVSLNDGSIDPGLRGLILPE